MRPASPVVEGLEQFEFKFGANQPEYLPLPALVGKLPEVNVISRWELTDEEREQVAAGADIYVSQATFGDLFHPIGVCVGGYKQNSRAFMTNWNVGDVLSEEIINNALDTLSDEL